LSVLLRLYYLESIYSPMLDIDLPRERLRERLEAESDSSLGLHPVHEHILHPSEGNFVLRTSLGT